jgi:hypothetical protein
VGGCTVIMSNRGILKPPGIEVYEWYDGWEYVCRLSNLTAQPASAGLGRLGLLGAEESISLFLSVCLSLVEAKTCAFSKLINHRS